VIAVLPNRDGVLRGMVWQILGMTVSIAGFIIAHVKFTNENSLPHAIIGEPLE
jgi:hypothetical protein